MQRPAEMSGPPTSIKDTLFLDQKKLVACTVVTEVDGPKVAKFLVG